MYLLWAGLFFLFAGIAALAVDRRAVNAIHDRVPLKLDRFLHKTTHMAKAGRWLVVAVVAYLVTWKLLSSGNTTTVARLIFRCSLAFVLALGAGSAVIHTIKLLLSRRRPRDELEQGLYGFIPFGFDLKRNSFPSGHALTITCVAVIATAVWPQGAVVWFALALWLSLTRALMNAHFLSDVLVGIGIGLIAAREVLVNWFPELTRPWF
jgi:membrane-associated phospholipid phosphatase